MNVIQRLLMREDIDALELDLARARERDPNIAPEICEEIARLERLIAQSAARRQPSPQTDAKAVTVCER
jgi:hypothetical protein